MYAFVLYEEGIDNHKQMETIAKTLEDYSQSGLPVLRGKSTEDVAPASEGGAGRSGRLVRIE